MSKQEISEAYSQTDQLSDLVSKISRANDKRDDEMQKQIDVLKAEVEDLRADLKYLKAKLDIYDEE